jgi:glycosyltransferase involved in cell wall biosynthesis
VYLAPADIQVARVDRQAIVYFCSALARQGVRVELIALGIRLVAAEKHRPRDPLSLYRLKTKFKVEINPTRLHQESRSWAIGVSRLIVHVRAAWRRVRRAGSDETLIFYTKNYAPALALLALRALYANFRIAFEVHVPPRGRLRTFILANVDAVIANSHALARDLGALRIPAKRLLGVHQGVDLEPYENDADRDALRSELALPVDQPLAVYTGKVFRGYTELEYIFGAAADQSMKDVLFLVVGGREDHVQQLRMYVAGRGLTNVILTGFVPPRDVHAYHRIADVLLLYYPSGFALNDYRSPGKLFEYMASGVPIAAVDLPVLREVLGDPPAAFVVPPDSPRDLARAIRAVLDDYERGSRVAEVARERVAEFTWDRRAEKIVQFLRRVGG